MPLYFRGDDRNPKDVFEEGFKNSGAESRAQYRNSYEELIDNWSLYTCFYRKNAFRRTLTDIDPVSPKDYGVCLTTMFEVASMFPFLDIPETFIYAISLPKATVPDRNLLDYNTTINSTISVNLNSAICSQKSPQTT